MSVKEHGRVNDLVRAIGAILVGGAHEWAVRHEHSPKLRSVRVRLDDAGVSFEKTRDAAAAMQDVVFEKLVPRLGRVAADLIQVLPGSALPVVVGYDVEAPELPADVVSMSFAGIEIDASSFSRDGFESRIVHWLDALDVIQQKVASDMKASAFRQFVVTGGAATFPMHVSSSSEGSMIQVFARGRREAAMKAVLAAHGPLTLRSVLSGERSEINETMVVSDTAGGNVNDMLGRLVSGDACEEAHTIDLPGVAPWTIRRRATSGPHDAL